MLHTDDEVDHIYDADSIVRLADGRTIYADNDTRDE